MASKFDVLKAVGPGTPTGEFMREYWVPAMLSSELVSDGPPHRLRMLGQDLVAFRDTLGRVGVLDEACPHRGVSLVLGRNENCGLRCLFHGWKFDVEGKAVEAPNEPAEYIKRIPAHGYPVDEAGGIVWIYLGAATPPPPRPALPFTTLPADQVFAMPGLVHANWLPVIEAGLDQTHVGILHQSAIGGPAYANLDAVSTMPGGGSSRFEFEDRPYGGSWRFLNTAEEEREFRVGEFVMPWWNLIGISPDPEQDNSILLTVPVDDTKTILWVIFYNLRHSLQDGGAGRTFASYCRSTQTYRTELPHDPALNWGQDRAAMDKHWTGIGVGRGGVGIFYEDIALMESIPASWDLSQQHLGPSDLLITRFRHRMLAAVSGHGRHAPDTSVTHDLSALVPQFSEGRVSSLG